MMKLSDQIKKHRNTEGKRVLLAQQQIEKWYHIAISLEKENAKMSAAMGVIRKTVKEQDAWFKEESLADIAKGRKESNEDDMMF